MKLKKIAIVLITILMTQFMFVQFNNFTLAAGETANPSVKIQLSSNDAIDINNVHREDEFELVARIKEIKNAGKGILVIGGTLNYDSNKLELLSLDGAGDKNDGWRISKNNANGKFVLDHEGYVTSAQDVLKMKFKVKSDAVESTESTPSKAQITITNIAVSGGNGIIRVDDLKAEATIVKPEEKEKKITSTVYKVDSNAWDISKIEPQTTIAQFLENITTENVEDDEIVFTDKDNNVITNRNTTIRTKMKIKIADKLTYTLIVKGDLDGEMDARGRVITENDLAQIKLHYIGHTVIQDPVVLKAANYDDDANREITVNDIALIKLNILGLLNATK